MLPFPILYEDPSCLVIDKPAGIVVQRTSTVNAGEPTLLELLTASRRQLFLAHRLDRGTTGCLLLAKSPEALETLQQQFRERRVEKHYLAIVAGVPKHQRATIDAPLGRSLLSRTKMSLFRTSRSRSASTSYTTLSMDVECALLRCNPTSGRTHQIRVHLAGIGHPILGDEKYGSEQSRRLSEQLQLQHPCLHAWKLAFISAATKERVQITAPIPETFRRIAEKLGLSLPAAAHE
jgi:23S rRNA pseudouridine955/2504/2580 synthase